MTNRIRGTAWIDLCDSCSMPLSGEGVRWRRRHLCPNCAESAIRADIAHGSMMLGAVARRRKEEADRRKKAKAADRAREYRLRQQAVEEREAHKQRTEMGEMVRQHVDEILNEPPRPCPLCGTVGCTRHPDEMDEEAEL